MDKSSKQSIISESTVKRVDSLALALTFIALGLVLTLIPQFFGHEFTANIFRWIFVFLGLAGFASSFNNRDSQILGTIDIALGILFLIGGIVAFSLIPSAIRRNHQYRCLAIRHLRNIARHSRSSLHNQSHDQVTTRPRALQKRSRYCRAFNETGCSGDGGNTASAVGHPEVRRRLELAATKRDTELIAHLLNIARNRRLGRIIFRDFESEPASKTHRPSCKIVFS